jgi:hypothetical protein
MSGSNAARICCADHVEMEYSVFVLSHLAAGARVLMLSHGAAQLCADRFLIGGATAAGLVAFAIMFGMCGARLNFAIP